MARQSLDWIFWVLFLRLTSVSPEHVKAENFWWKTRWLRRIKILKFLQGTGSTTTNNLGKGARNIQDSEITQFEAMADESTENKGKFCWQILFLFKMASLGLIKNSPNLNFCQTPFQSTLKLILLLNGFFKWLVNQKAYSMKPVDVLLVWLANLKYTQNHVLKIKSQLRNDRITVHIFSLDWLCGLIISPNY